MPDMTDVKSSNVHSVGYDQATKELHVKFKSGGPVYVYRDVDEQIGLQAHTQESVGKFLHSHVKGKHKWERRDGS